MSGLDQHLTFFHDNIRHSVLLVSHWYVPKLLDYAKKYPHKVSETLLVIDEMHHLGSDGYKLADLIQNNDAIQEDSEEQSLSVDVNDFDPEHFSTFKMRLGLSATPWDEYDDKKEPVHH